MAAQNGVESCHLSETSATSIDAAQGLTNQVPEAAVENVAR